jgi:hypothetical protein
MPEEQEHNTAVAEAITEPSVNGADEDTALPLIAVEASEHTPTLVEEFENGQNTNTVQEARTDEFIDTTNTASDEPVADAGEPPDYRALYEAEKQKASSVQGQVRKQRERDAAIDQQTKMLRKMMTRLELLEEQAVNPDVDMDDLRERRDQMNAADAQADVNERATGRVQNMVDRMQAKFQRVGADLTAPQFADGYALWQRGANNGNVEDIEEAYSILDEALDEYSQKRLAQEDVNARRQNGELRTDNGRSSASSVSSGTGRLGQLARKGSNNWTKEDVSWAKSQGII